MCFPVSLHKKKALLKKPFSRQGSSTRSKEPSAGGSDLWDLGWRRHILAQGEASGVDVHLGEAQMFERGGQGESCLHGDVAQQVGLLPALLQLVGGVVQHLLVAVAHLLHLQPVDLPAQADELAGQAVILDLHLPLWIQKQDLK